MTLGVRNVFAILCYLLSVFREAGLLFAVGRVLLHGELPEFLHGVVLGGFSPCGLCGLRPLQGRLRRFLVGLEQVGLGLLNGLEQALQIGFQPSVLADLDLLQVCLLYTSRCV